ncbi:MAG: Jag N-terminal domain-containing protein [bacterium]|nr:Jag N-terminal domain-containing protein [bacterium]
MLKEIKFEAKTDEEALEYAVNELKVNKEEITLEVLEETKGFLGIGRKALYKASYEFDIVSDAKKYLDDILSGMGIEYQLECRSNEDEINFAIESSDNPLLIGKDGKCLDALLTLLKLYISKLSDDKMMVGLDIGGYRANRKRQLEVLATKTAKEVARTKIEVKLKPMNAYERKIIHEKLADWRDVYTESEGEGLDRALVIKPKK